MFLIVLAVTSPAQVLITELHYHPLDSLWFETVISDDVFEFIELKNTGTQAVDLSGYAFTQGITYLFQAGDSILPGEFIVLASDPTWFAGRYGFVPLGQYSGQLRNSGETVTLVNSAGGIADQVTYSDISPWPIAADGSGNSLAAVDPGRAGDPNDPATWRASTGIGGSPCADDVSVQRTVILINEALTHTDLPEVDFIELYNPGDVDVDLGGWYLTDNNAEPKKYRFPDNTLITAGGYLVINETHFNADSSSSASFRLNSHGDEAFIFEADAQGNLTGYNHGFKFGEIENGISFGRHVNSVGTEHFVPQLSITEGAENSGPRVGPLVISEIMYNAPDGADFLEITNISGEAVALFDPGYPQNTWGVDGITFTFPVNLIMQPGEKALLIDDTVSAEAFRSSYGISSSIKIYPFLGNLRDDGETLTLEKPEEPFLKDTAIVVPYMLIDQVGYDDAAPWPAVSAGQSLQRRDLSGYGNDPANWIAQTAAPAAQSSKHPVPYGREQAVIERITGTIGGSAMLTVRLSLEQAETVRISIYGLNGHILTEPYVYHSNPGTDRLNAVLPKMCPGLVITVIEIGDKHHVFRTGFFN